MYLVVDTFKNEILVSGESARKNIGSAPNFGFGARIAKYDNKLLSFGNLTLNLLILSFNRLIYNRKKIGT